MRGAWRQHCPKPSLQPEQVRRAWDAFHRAQGLGLAAAEGRSGLWQLPGEFQFPTAGCTPHFCFPFCEGRQPKPGRSLAPVQDHLRGTVPVPASLLAHTDFLFSPPHPSLSALPQRGWRAAHRRRGTPEVWPLELGGQQGAPILRIVAPWATGWLGSPESPSPRERFYFQPGLMPALGTVRSEVRARQRQS